MSELASLKTMLRDRTHGSFGNPETLEEFLILYNKVSENDTCKLTDQEITDMWNGAVEEKAIMAKEKAETQAKRIAYQIDNAKYTEAKIKAMADPMFVGCCEENLKLGDNIFYLKKQPDGTYQLAYKCTVGEIKIVQEYIERWMTCGYVNVTRFLDQDRKLIESIETLFKQVMMNMAFSDVKVGDKAYAEDGTEAGIVTEVSFTYSECWNYSDGPTKTKMVKVDGGDLIEASNFFIKV
jgi:hypothetical protein